MSENSNVVQIGDFGIARKRAGFLRELSDCSHKQVELDDHGHVVKCLKCSEVVSAYWYLAMLAADWDKADRDRKHKDEKLRADLDAGLTLQAARRVEQAWRCRSSIPTCPHCERGISQHDHFGASSIGRQFEQRRRIAENGKVRPMPEIKPPSPPTPAKDTP